MAIANGIRPAIFHWKDAVALSEAAQAAGHTALFHLAVDTGMSRLGFQATEESLDLCEKIVKLPGIQAEGLFSHFATADSADLERSRKQAELFDWFDGELKKRGIDHVKVVYSKEEPQPAKAVDEETGKAIPASIAFVPPAVGLLLASEVIKDLISK
jgi:alanine racemase